MPVNFEAAQSREDFRSVTEASTVKTLLRLAHLPQSDIIERPVYTQQNSSGWIGPTIFIAYALLSQQPHLVSVALSTIANYLTDFFRGSTEDPSVTINVVAEKELNRIYKKITYEGPPDGVRSSQK